MVWVGALGHSLSQSKHPCTFRSSSFHLLVNIIIIYIIIIIYLLYHSPSGVIHSDHTLSTFLRIRADPSMLIFWVSVTIALSELLSKLLPYKERRTSAIDQSQRALQFLPSLLLSIPRVPTTNEITLTLTCLANPPDFPW